MVAPDNPRKPSAPSTVASAGRAGVGGDEVRHRGDRPNETRPSRSCGANMPRGMQGRPRVPCRVPGCTSVDGFWPSTSERVPAVRLGAELRRRALACPRQTGRRPPRPTPAAIPRAPARSTGRSTPRAVRRDASSRRRRCSPSSTDHEPGLAVRRRGVERPVGLGEPAPELVRAALRLGLGGERVLDVRVPVVQAVGERRPSARPVQGTVAVRAAVARAVAVHRVRRGACGRPRAAPASRSGSGRCRDVRRRRRPGVRRPSTSSRGRRGRLPPRPPARARCAPTAVGGRGRRAGSRAGPTPRRVGPVTPADLRERPAESQSVENLLTSADALCNAMGPVSCRATGVVRRSRS